MDELLNKVKLALRISHTVLDEDINNMIKSARAELNRSGVSSDVSQSSEYPLVNECIVLYVKSLNAPSQAEREGYFNAFQYALDNLRKSSAYKEAENV